MKVIIIFLFSVHMLFAQGSTYIEYKTYKGFVFDSSMIVLKSVLNQRSRFTPSEADIILAEKILTSQLKKLNYKKNNQGWCCPVIHKKLRKYYRQYVGYVDKDGNKIIWINFFWKDDDIKNAKYDIISAFDGCSRYWNIEVHLKNSILQKLEINGNG